MKKNEWEKNLLKKSAGILTAVFIFMSAVLLASCAASSDDDDDSGKEEEPPVTANAACPVFSPIGGFYKEKQTVTISCEDSTAIYYTVLKPTLDDSGNWDEEAWQNAVAASKPTEESLKYTEPFEVSEQCIIRAVAVKADGTKNYAMTCFDFDLDRSTDFSGPLNPVNPDSEDWQDQTIYFILTDRFFNGDTTNDHVAGLKDGYGNDYDERTVLEGQPASGYTAAI